MQNIIHIPEPCSEKWSTMKSVGNKQRHCDMCKHNVRDFSKSSLSEISSKHIEEGESILCGHYHERHTTNNNKVYVFANYIEYKLTKINFKRSSFFLVAIVLMLSGCAKRYTKGRRVKGDFFSPDKQSSKEIEIQKILK
jgi:hypothetical protein